MSDKDKGMLNRLSLVPAGLKYKLMIVFSLMSIIPLYDMRIYNDKLCFSYI